MSVPSADEKAAAAGAVHSRRLLPKLLTGTLPLAILLLWSTDAFAIHRTPLPPSRLLPDFLGPISIKSTATSAFAPSLQPASLPSWISAFILPNFTSTLMSRWLTPRSEPCRDSPTADISIPALDSSSSSSSSVAVLLPAGDIHEFTIQTLDAYHRPRCLGGDYFEIDLSGPNWKSRPPILDLGNGSYIFRLQIHPSFASNDSSFTLTIVLLFRSFDGLKLSPDRFSVRRELRRISIQFIPSSFHPPSLSVCRSSDFTRAAWSGRWTRHARNDSCAVDHSGRYRCIDAAFPCEIPWCRGALGALESNGWVYSAHCAFRLFDQPSAWRCLAGRWLLFWGDSNHVDTIRNLLNFVLGLDGADADVVHRRFDRRFTNPRNSSETIRITNIFNGHWNESLNYLGLASLRYPAFRNHIWKFFDESSCNAPDTVVLNSGLHDGFYWKSVRSFAYGADQAARFWEEVMAHVMQRNLPCAAKPRVFYRTTVAAGGYARDMGFNPNKMEAFDGILKEKLAARGVVTGVVDEFDMTFPWHFDNRCNDGVHYGRKPAMAKWRDGQIGHQYFVDLMLVHVLLNAFCNA